MAGNHDIAARSGSEITRDRRFNVDPFAHNGIVADMRVGGETCGAQKRRPPYVLVANYRNHAAMGV
jgi:hypothetical protein